MKWLIVLASAVACTLARAYTGVYLSNCFTGTRCYPTQSQSSSYYGCNKAAYSPRALPYCIVNGTDTPDPQTGYLGVCPTSVYTGTQVCVDCTTGTMCSGQGPAGPVPGFNVNNQFGALLAYGTEFPYVPSYTTWIEMPVCVHTASSNLFVDPLTLYTSSLYSMSVVASGTTYTYWVPSGGVCTGYSASTHNIFSYKLGFTSQSLPVSRFNGACYDGSIVLPVPSASSSQYTYSLCVSDSGSSVSTSTATTTTTTTAGPMNQHATKKSQYRLPKM